MSSFVEDKTTSRIHNLIGKSKMELSVNRGLSLQGKAMVNTNAFDGSKVSSSVSTEQSEDIVADYLESSSVHGIKYTGHISVKLGWFGRLFWVCTMVACLVGSSLMVYKFWNRYNSNPTFTYVKTFFQPTSSVPFPAVAICPFQPMNNQRQKKIAEMLVPPDNMTTEELFFIVKNLHELANPEISARERFVPYKQKLDEILKVNNWELAHLLQYSMSCEDFFSSCWFNGHKLSCKDHFRISHSSQGMCCSFNYILEEHILGRVEHKPLYPFGYGVMTGLRVVVNEEILKSYRSGDPLSRVFTNSEGALIFINHVAGYPGDTTPTRILQSADELQIEVKPKLDILQPGLSHTTPDGFTEPLCIPASKMAINYIPVYRLTNCYTSCKVELMLRICGCVPFNYEPIARNSSIKSCTLSDYDCLKKNAPMFRIVQNIRTKEFTCICRQPCNNIAYEVKITKTEIDERAIRTTPAYKGSVTKGQAVLRVFMELQYFTVYETIQTTSEISLLASLGGVFGLFLGCSFISAAEIFYFAVLFYRAVSARLRGARNKRHRRKHNFHEDVKMFH